MKLTGKQRKYLKKQLREQPLRKVADNLGVSEKELLKYLKNYWRKDKYQKFLAKRKTSHFQDSSQGQSSIKNKIDTKVFSKKRGIVFAFLAFLVFAVYANALNNEFLSDDIAAIVNNKNIGNFSNVFLQPLGFIRPFLYFLTYKIGGLNPFIFRFSNLVFHLGSVWLVYTIICLHKKQRLALFTASIFAVHPILIESVTWISGGVHIQYSFFLLLAFLFYLFSSKDSKFLLASIGCFVLSLISSEKAIIFPLILFVYMIAFQDWRKKWKTLIPFFILSGFWGLISLRSIGPRIGTLETTFYQGAEKPKLFYIIPIAITSYLKLIFWPKDLTLYHTEMFFSQIEYAIKLIVSVSCLGIIGYSYKHNKHIFFWLSFFIISLLPTLTPFGVSWIVAERYVYLGSIGIIYIIALIIQKLGQICKNPKISYILFGIILLAFSFRTIARNTDWKNQDSLWLAAAKTSPSSHQNHNNLGDMYGRHGDLDKAAEEFKKAIELNPNYGDAIHNLANIYLQQGKIDLAIENYKKATEINPSIWQSHSNLSGIYFRQENYQEAEKYARLSVKANPNISMNHYNLAVVFLKQGKTDEMRAAIEKAISLDPENQQAIQLLNSLNNNKE